MRRRWKLCVGAALFAGVMFLLLLDPHTLAGWRRGEPCYRGRPVAYWRYRLRDWRIDYWRRPETEEEKLREREEQRQGIDFVGVSGYPEKWTLGHRENRTRTSYGQKWYDKWLGSSNWSNPAYGTPFCRLEILDGHPGAVPVLTALLADEDVRIRRLAAASLGRIGLQAQAAVPALLEAANGDDDAFLRGIARVAVLDIDHEAAEKAGINEHFVFWSPQPKLRAGIRGRFFLGSPAAFLTEGKILAWENKTQTIKVYELATGRELGCFRGPAGTALSAFSPDAKTAASVSQGNKTVSLWDLATGKELAVLRGRAHKTQALAFSPDGKTLAWLSDDKTVQLWDIVTGKERTFLRGHNNYVDCLRFSPDGKTLASGSGDRTVKLWDVSTGKERATFRHDPRWGAIYCLAFSPDGKILASGSMDYTVKLWDVTTGKKLASLEGYKDDGGVDSVAFSPDGKTLASVSWDTIFLWDPATGKNTAKILAEMGDVNRVTFTPDGRILAVSRGDDHSERLWEFAEIPDEKAVSGSGRSAGRKVAKAGTW
jgi:hypothetical protein